MIRSMTGYSRVEDEEAGIGILVAIAAPTIAFLTPNCACLLAWSHWKRPYAGC